ncbi:MAG TPA: hypothetical protein EYP17_02150 [Candidatus Latescibacteria bacterium]|nr:hypothetical protein [Candidatus Latescibacterota bacterium]
MLKVLLALMIISKAWAGEGPSPAKAFLLSLLLPAAGHRYLGEDTAALWSLRAEVGLWAGYIGFRTWSSWREEDAWAYAASQAGARGEKEDEAFWDAMGFYPNVYEYNRAVLWRKGASACTYSERPPAWEWPGEEERLRFKALKDSSLRARHWARMVLWGIVGYHLASALRAAQAVGSRTWKVSAFPFQDGVEILLRGGF